MNDLIPPSVAATLPALPPNLASKYAERFAPFATPVEFSGVYLADAAGRTIATRWDASRYVHANGTAMTERRQAEVDAALAEVAKRVNSHDNLVHALRALLACFEPNTPPATTRATLKAARAVLAANEGE